MDNLIVKQKGMPGHFIGCNNCCYHIHSVIKDLKTGESWKVSTIGCYHPESNIRRDGCRTTENRETVGRGRYYETMVFYEDELSELDMEGYQTEEEADEGHFRILNTWLRGLEQGELRSNATNG